MVDTGATHNYILIKKAKSLKLPIKEGTRSFK